MKKMLEIEIAGQTYRIASRYEADYMQEISTYLNKKLAQVKRSTKSHTLQKALILVALDIIDEHLQYKVECDSERKLLKAQVSDILKEVDERLAQLES